MNKKSVLGLLLFSCIVIASMFFGTMFMIKQHANTNIIQEESSSNAQDGDGLVADQDNEKNGITQPNQDLDLSSEEEWLNTDESNGESQTEDSGLGENRRENSSLTDENNQLGSSDQIDDGLIDIDDSANNEIVRDNPPSQEQDSDSLEELDSTETLGDQALDLPDMQLIRDSSQVDYMSYLPEMVFDSKIEIALDIDNPSLNINAKSAILFDATTGTVLYYKDPIIPVFPASTAKLLTALVAVDWCMEEEEVTVGEELCLVASDSTLARLKKGQVLTIRNLLEGMLVPSGNDAAYVIASYVGRKSLRNENASLKEAIPEFIRLMNEKAKSLGVVNSCFKTPDGYDAIGQYTTAYDMGLIGLAAADNETIVEISNKSRARNVFVDGSDVTWANTNSLIRKDSGRYYSSCVGLKTGSSTMAGRCLISVGRKDGRQVVSVIMNSDSVGRWEDSITLLKYGLGQ